MTRPIRLLLVSDHSGNHAEFVARKSSAHHGAVALMPGREARLRQRSLRAFAQLLRSDGFATRMAYGTGGLGQLVSAPPIRGVIIDLVELDCRWVVAARYARSFIGNVPIFFVTAHPGALQPLVQTLSPPVLVFAKPLDYRAFSQELKRHVLPHSGFITAVKPHAGETLRTSKLDR